MIFLIMLYSCFILGSSAQTKPKTTTKPPSPSGPSLISDRLNDFILGPKSEFRSNAFSEIPTNGATYDSLNPLAGFMGRFFQKVCKLCGEKNVIYDLRKK